MSGITGTGTTYTLPNYVGELFQLTPSDTPLLSVIGGLTGGKSVASVEWEWQTEDMRSVAQPAVLEGQDAPTAQERVRSAVTNVVQIHQESVAVTYTKLAAYGQKAGTNNDQQNPIRNELDHQVGIMLRQMARDVEYSFIMGVYQKPSDNTTARKTRGFVAAVTTNVVDAQSTAGVTGTTSGSGDTITSSGHGLSNGDTVILSAIATTTGITNDTAYFVVSSATDTFKVATTSGGSAIDLVTNGTAVWKKGVALTNTHVDNALQLAYDNGGLNGQTATLIVNSAQKRAITAVYAALYGKYFESSRNMFGVNLTTLETDFGTLNIMLNRYVPNHRILIASLEQLSPVFLEVPGKGHFFAEPLAKTGAQEKVHFYGEVGLEYGNEKAHAQILDLKLPG